MAVFTVRTPRICILSNGCFLFGVHRNDRLRLGSKSGAFVRDIPELSLSIGMVFGAFVTCVSGLKAIIVVMEEVGDGGSAP
jgi:hypothetical protein